MSNKVKEWTERMGVKPGGDTAALYIKLIEEEYQELMEAAADGNFQEIVDAAIDLKWVIDGLLLMLQVDIGVAENTVVQSNFSKWCYGEDIAQASVAEYANKGVDAYYEQLDFNSEKYYIIKRNEDNKILKPVTYQKPDWGHLVPPDWF